MRGNIRIRAVYKLLINVFFLNLLQFSQKVAPKLLQTPKLPENPKVAPNSEAAVLYLV